MRMRFLVAPLLLAFSVAFCAARENSTNITTAQLGHYRIRPIDLPRPHATPVAATISRVVNPPEGTHLKLPPGFSAVTWAAGWFDDPRNMILAPTGEVLVADSGSGRIIGVADRNGDGVAEMHRVVAERLPGVFGLAFRGDQLYAGATDRVVRFRWNPSGPLTGGVEITRLPAGGHSTRNLAFNANGTKLYVSVGSASNDSAYEPKERAAILEMNPDGTAKRIFASGLRNPVALTFAPGTSTLYTAVNERDGLGDNLPPDYFTSVRDGGFYGWPFAYIGRHADPTNGSRNPALIEKTIEPDVLFQAHSAPLCAAFYNGTMFPAEYRGSAFVALHGSWNRAELTGYKVVRVPFVNGRPTGEYDDFIVGWTLDSKFGTVWGRPVGVLVLPDGSLLVSDDGAKKIWRVSYRR